MGFFKSKEEKAEEQRQLLKEKKYRYSVYADVITSSALIDVLSLIELFQQITQMHTNKNLNKVLESALNNEFICFEKNISIDESSRKDTLKEVLKSFNFNLAIEGNNYLLAYSAHNIQSYCLGKLYRDVSIYQVYLEALEGKNDEDKKLFIAHFCSVIPSIISSIFNKKFIYNHLKADDAKKDFVSFINDISESYYDNEKFVDNLTNIHNELYGNGAKHSLIEYDIYNFIKLSRRDYYIDNLDEISRNSMKEKTNLLLENIVQSSLSSFDKSEFEKIVKQFVNDYEFKAFVKTDYINLKTLDYYIVSLLLKNTFIEMEHVISYLVEGLVTKNYKKTYAYKKALWDSSRYREKDYSEELKTQSIDVLYKNVESGYEFESFCYTLFSELGYQVEQTKLSNDQGADLIIQKDSIKKVVQAKFYSSTVGNKAVQEAVAAKAHYNAQYAIVITNNFYTPSAKSLAKSNSVELIDGDDIQRLILECIDKEIQ